MRRPRRTAAALSGLALGALAVATTAGAAAAHTAAVARCTAHQLVLTAGKENGGVGHVGFPLRFTNTSVGKCSLHGYPGVQALDKHGKPNMNAERTKSGYLGGDTRSGPPPTVVLHPGDVASAYLEGTDMPTGQHKSCPQAAAFRVTPPNTHRATLLKRSLPECSRLQIHPVVPGKSGQEH